MSVEKSLRDHLSSFHTAPFLFVGSGMSRRYLGLENWAGLLAKFAGYTDRSYEYYRSTAGGNLPQTASEMANRFHETWWSADEWRESRERNRAESLNMQSALKIEISRYMEERSDSSSSGELAKELESLGNVVVDGIITTNWDLLLEALFPDFRPFIGQDELLFKSIQSIAEIYKIHGCCSRPNSLVLTAEDYKDFNGRNPYLASKLLTVFVEHPVVFLGYSLNDENISQILQSIASCLRNSNIDQLRDRLVFVQWDPELQDPVEENSNIVTGGFTIPVKTISTPGFLPVFSALGAVPRKFPANLLRRLKKHVYNLVKDNDPVGQMFVKDIDDDTNIADLQVVFGVGLEQHEIAMKLEDGDGALPVRLTTDPDAPSLPYRLIEPPERYESAQEAARGAFRSWKSAENAYVPAELLWELYARRLEIQLEDEESACFLVSSAHHGCPTHYWASLLGRDKIYNLLRGEVEKDLYPRIRAAGRLAFALGMSTGEEILDLIASKSQYTSARQGARRLRQALDSGSNVFREYHSPVFRKIELDGEDLETNTEELFDDKEATERAITLLASAESRAARTRARQLDAIFYGSNL